MEECLHACAVRSTPTLTLYLLASLLDLESPSAWRIILQIDHWLTQRSEERSSRSGELGSGGGRNEALDQEGLVLGKDDWEHRICTAYARLKNALQKWFCLLAYYIQHNTLVASGRRPNGSRIHAARVLRVVSNHVILVVLFPTKQYPVPKYQSAFTQQH